MTWSEETYRIFEVDRAGFGSTHLDFLTLVHPEDRAKVEAAVAEASGSRSLNSIEHRIVTPGGLVKQVEERWWIVEDDQGRPARALGTCQDITDRKQAEEEIRRYGARLKVLADASQACAAAGQDYQAVLDQVVSLVVDSLGDGCHVRLLSEDGERLDFVALHTADPEVLEVARALLTQAPKRVDDPGFASHVFRTGEPVFLPVTTTEQLRAANPPQLWPVFERFAIHSIIVVPLRMHGRIIGVLSVNRYRSDQPAFSEDDLNLAQDLADRAALAISNARLLDRVQDELAERKLAEAEIRRQARQLRRTVEGAVLAMSLVVETRDPYTAGHERRVSELATAIAGEMGMEGEELAALRLASLIHDIGKIAVPSEILSKPGRLSEIEFGLIRQHPQAGFDILDSVDFGLPVAEIVLQHHERLDGSGYPRALTGEGILPGARILAVADVVEAMSSHRPYRPALGIAAALTEVREHAGVKYDAEVAAVCVRLVEEQGFQFST